MSGKKAKQIHSRIQENNRQFVSFRENICRIVQGIRHITQCAGKMDKAVFRGKNRRWNSRNRRANKGSAKTKCSVRGGKLNIKKSDCNIHSTLRQRLTAIKLLSSEHAITTLCRILNVNRSTYYDFINHKPSNREKENQYIRSCILEIYAKTDKRLGVQKIAICLKHDYCINISTGRVYRLMKTMNLPKMSTIKPKKQKAPTSENGSCRNILAQNFNQTKPNTVWVCDFTYIRVGTRFYTSVQ